MGYFNNVPTTYLCLERVSCIAVYAGSKEMGLEQYEDEKLMTELSL